MRMTTTAAVLMLLGVLAVPGLAAPKPAKPAAGADLDKNTNSVKMVKAGRVVGKVIGVNETKKSVRVQITYTILKLNTGALNSMIQAKQQMAQATDQNGLIQAQQNYLKAQATLYQPEQKTQDIEVTTTEDVKIRVREPKAQFDDKGNEKKLTRKEKLALKGDPKLPGYPGEFADLRENQYIEIQLVRKKGVTPRPAPRRKPNKDADVDLLDENLPQASRIVVIIDPETKK
jgi:hypothetical protein